MKLECSRVSLFGGLITAVIGAVVIAGWHSRMPALIQISPQFATMKYNVALEFISIGLALVLANFSRQREAFFLGAFVLVFGALHIYENLFDFNLGIDQFFVRDFIDQGTPPGRMSTNTAYAFTFLGAALLCLNQKLFPKARFSFTAILGSIALAYGFAPFIAYFLGLEPFQVVNRTTHTGLLRAIGLTASGLGVVAIAWRNETARVMGSPLWSHYIVGAAVLTVSFGLAQAIELHDGKVFKERLKHIVDEIGWDISEINERCVDGLSRDLQDAGMGGDAWKSAVAFRIDSCAGIKTVAWLDAAATGRWVAPREGNEKFINLDFAAAAHWHAAVENARAARKEVAAVTGGGNEMAILTPTFRENQLAGFALGIIDINKLLAGNLAHHLSFNVKFAIFLDRRVIYNAAAPEEKEEISWRAEKTALLHGIPFQLLVWPDKKLRATLDNRVPLSILLSGVLVAFFASASLRLLQAKTLDAQTLGDLNVKLKNEIGARTNTEDQLRKLSRAAEQSPSPIIITDRAGAIEYVNPKFTQISGYGKEEVIGKNPRILKSGTRPEESYTELWATISAGGEWRGEFLNKRKNGESFWVKSSISPIKDAAGNVTHFIASMEDISELKQLVEKLSASVREKEILVREVEHRAKNNMQVIGSLIKMQCRDIQEPASLAILRDLRNRITSMSIVHNHIFKSNDLSHIDTQRYLLDLSRHILNSFGKNTNKIELQIDTHGVSLGVETCVHCGLLINELITNSLKHAFPGERPGKIEVTLRREEAIIELIVGDNGTGMKDGIDIRNTQSLGMRLVTALAEEQLHGTVELTGDRGTTFKIKFPERGRDETR